MNDQTKALLVRAQNNPGDDAALAELAPVLREAGDWALLRNVLAQRAELATSDVDRAALWLEHGQLCERELRDLSQAEASYARAAAFDPTAAAALARVRERLGQ